MGHPASVNVARGFRPPYRTRLQLYAPYPPVKLAGYGQLSPRDGRRGGQSRLLV